MKDVQKNHTFFDTAFLQDAGEQLRNPELFREILGFEMFFRFFLKQKTEVLVLGQRISIVQIVKFGKTAKSIFF